MGNRADAGVCGGWWAEGAFAHLAVSLTLCDVLSQNSGCLQYPPSSKFIVWGRCCCPALLCTQMRPSKSQYVQELKQAMYTIRVALSLR